MALDEFLFSKVMRFLRKRKASAEQTDIAAEFETIKPRLTILARALTGKPISLFPAIKDGGYKGNSFFLPEKCSVYSSFETNVSFYLFRLLFLSVQQQLELNWYSAESLSDAVALSKATEAAPKVLSQLFEDFPPARELHEKLRSEFIANDKNSLPGNLLYGRWMVDSREDLSSEDLSVLPSNPLRPDPGDSADTIIKARPVEEIINLSIDQKQQEDYVLTHNFEKVETAEEFNGSWRDFNGEDELEDHQDALDELNMKYTVRVNDTAHSIYEAGYTADASVAESKDSNGEGNFVPYDEWNCFKRIYRKDYIKVYPQRQPVADPEYYAQTIAGNHALLERLRKMLTGIRNQWQQQRLQIQGREIDIDVAADRFADLVSGHTPEDRVYFSDRRKEKDLSLLLLLDLSLSSDSYVDGNRVIDVAKQTAILFGEVLNEFGIDFSICGFYSKTRNYAAFVTLKDFDDKWSSAKFFAGAPQPEGYTRIGPALRHSGALLRNRPAKSKWVILLSDGKPNDFDRYEGKYGIGDVKQALRELAANRVNTYALAIEAAARYYLPQMFGQDHYQVISSPAALFSSLIKLYERIRYAA